VFVGNDREFQQACRLLRELITGGKVGIGFDVATTTGETSNPSSVTVTEQRGLERTQRLVVLWKEKKPQIARERLKEIVRAVAERRQGGRASRMCIDASNERYFAEQTRDELSSVIPVQLIINSESVEPLPSGYEEAINYKTYLGDLYATAVNDNRYALPSAEYIKQDHRLPVKNAGRFECDAQPDGKHGDTFDSGKLAEYALIGPSGTINAENIRRIRVGGSRIAGHPVFIPNRLS
jgi:hypothetical protein